MIKIYVLYKIDQLVKKTKKFFSLFLEIKTYLYIWLSMALGIVLSNILEYRPVNMLFLPIPLFFIILVWVIIDYKSGMHNYWWKKKLQIPTKVDIKKLKKEHKLEHSEYER